MICCMEVSTMNLPTKLAYNPFFADKLAKFADEILLYGRNRLVFETRGGGGGGCHTPLLVRNLHKFPRTSYYFLTNYFLIKQRTLKFFLVYGCKGNQSSPVFSFSSYFSLPRRFKQFVEASPRHGK